MIILVVDDDPGIVELYRGYFVNMGEVRVAYGLEQGLAEMRLIPHPDLVLLDLIYAGSNPISAEQTLNHVKLFREIHSEAVIMVITGSSEERLLELARQMGVDHAVHKGSVRTQRRLFEACRAAALHRPGAGQALLDKLNELLTPNSPETA